MSGSLFSKYFLEDSVATTAAWQEITAEHLHGARDIISAAIEDFAGRAAPNEANTEHDLIEPILRLLGWDHFSKQETASRTGRSDVPDYLLFVDAGAKATAVRAANDRYRHGATILEAKKWEVPLDNATRAEAAPSTQILRYLGAVSVLSSDAIRFGILTNGRIWRLYDQKARSRLEGFVEFDLAETIASDHDLRVFLTFFSRAAFVAGITGRTVLVDALEASRRFEAQVTDALAETVFERVFPDLSSALAANDPERGNDGAYYADLREAALTWLYRLLFVLYAEDRDLLPTRQRDDGLSAMRHSVARAIDTNGGLSQNRANHDGDLRALWVQIDVGDRGIGLPPYNGGLFRQGRSPLLDRSLIPDAAFAPLLDALSRETLGSEPRFINYRDLSVQHLGSVYERLLEYDLVEQDGAIVARPQTFARKTSGSYYTPEELVMLVIRRTIGPLLDEKRAAFDAAIADPSRRNQDAAYRIGWLEQYDPAAAFLTLRICDPAMGSGHFLVSLVDYLADQVMVETRRASEAVDFSDYRSPLLDRLESIRDRILSQAAANDWQVDPAQLIDRQLVRRIILKRVIHGVDKNPMAVELAKLSLWLHTFTVGAPLSFLDHHLRCGDSLFGEWVRPALDRMDKVGLLRADAVRQAERSVAGMELIESLTDADLVEVHQSSDSFDAVQADTRDLREIMSLIQGFRWVGQSTEDALKASRKLRKEIDSIALGDPARALELGKRREKLIRQGMALETLLEGGLGDPRTAIDLCYGRIGDPDPARAQVAEALRIAHDVNFFHWELAFPNVWRDWQSRTPSGGFDAIIGNPPWDRLKMQEVEWFAARRPAIAHATRASDRKRMVRELHDEGDELAEQYERASDMAGLAARMANLKADKSGQFPLLGGGDVNLYSLFVERAARLVKPDGIVGLLTPSGIAGDLSASAFFRSVSTTGRLGALLDYENKKIFFPDVHASFKFCAIIFGGADRHFAAAECGFVLRATDDEALAETTFPLAPADFAAVNPNTGTAPVFRTVRDADLTTAIYARLPVLVDRRIEPPRKAWPVRYSTMFHMTNDSHLFRTRAELVADGWYPVEGGRIRKGKAEAVPLYEGKMVQAFDHRAASVVVNLDNLHRPGQPEAATLAEHQDPTWAPDSQFWVATADLPDLGLPGYVFGYKEITAPTNARTFIGSLFPSVAFGNKVPIFVPVSGKDYRATVVSLVANTNAYAFDYIVRQKVQGQTLNLFIVEQLPVIPPAAYDRAFGPMTAREIVAREVLHLTYTAHDMAPFARDMGHVDKKGEALPPFAWDEADRRQRRARLDALYFHLYGLSRDDADYILSTFPIVRSKDEAAFDGRYVTRDLILAQMAALDAGDPNAVIALR